MDEQLLETIQSIQSIFPADFIEAMWFNLVDDENFLEVLARSLSIFPPIYLPILERDGDLYAVHLYPERPWEESSWVLLPHDQANTILVSTSLRYLPGGMITPPHYFLNRVEKFWPTILELTNSIKGGILPEKLFFTDKTSDRTFLRAIYDREDGAARIAHAIEGIEDDGEILQAIEKILQELPNNTLTLAAAAAARQKFGHSNFTQPAAQVIMSEVFIGFNYLNELFMPETVSEVLQLMLSLALQEPDSDQPFRLLQDISFNRVEDIFQFQGVAEEYLRIGEKNVALNQIRNGATIAANNFALNQEWCQLIARYTESIEPDGLSTRLALAAAEVIDLGA